MGADTNLLHAHPAPIPNSLVKPCNADDPPWATAWESRTPPDLFS